MNRRNFLKALTGGVAGTLIASALPDSVIAKQVSRRHAEVFVDAEHHCYITIGDSKSIEVDSLNIRIQHKPITVSGLGDFYPNMDNTPTTTISVEHFRDENLPRERLA